MGVMDLMNICNEHLTCFSRVEKKAKFLHYDLEMRLPLNKKNEFLNLGTIPYN
jgi:hypothetical protein